MTLALLPGMFARAEAGGVETWPVHGRLGLDSRIDLAISRVNRDVSIDLLLASKHNSHAKLADAVQQCGAEIRSRDDMVGYLRVRVSLEKLDEILAHPAIAAVIVNRQTTANERPVQELRSIGLLSPRPKASPDEPSLVGDRPLREADANSPQIFVNAVDWLARFPTYDGRGTVVGYSERLGGFDPLLPEFAATRTNLDGTLGPKIVGFRTSADPYDRTKMRWTEMKTRILVSDKLSFEFNGHAFWAPRAGSFRIGVVEEPPSEDLAGSDYQWDINQNGRLGERLTVLWDDVSDEVWIDGEADRDFRETRALSLRAVEPDIGELGRDDPVTPWRESIGFTVQASADRRYLVLNLGVFDHASLLSNVGATGRGAARFTGVAPGAGYTMMISDEASPGAFIESLIALAQDEKTDVIAGAPAHGTIFSSTKGKNGEEFETLLMDRIVRHYRKPILVPGGNMPGQRETSDRGLSSEVVSVGGYRSKQIFERNFGVLAANDDNISPGADSAGPAPDGGLKPDVLAPTGHVMNALGYFGRAMPVGAWRFAKFPPGYGMGSGSSQAAPIASGCYALLVSAAKQRGLPYDPERLNFAVRHSARFLPGYQAYQQGNGLIDVEAAWRLLEQLKDESPLQVEVRAPVRTAHSANLPTPHSGRGLYEREGWRPGQTGERTIVLKRTSGPDGDLPFRLGWIGNEGRIFSTLGEVTLPLDRPVSLTVRVGPLPSGTSSAIMEGIGQTSAQRFRVLCTIVAADPIPTAVGSHVANQIVVSPPKTASWFFDVPNGLRRIELHAQSMNGLPVSVFLQDPQGTRRFLNNNGQPAASRPASIARFEDTIRVDDPTPGVWEALIARPLHGDLTHAPLEPMKVEIELRSNGPDKTPLQLIDEGAGTIDPGTQKAYRIRLPEEAAQKVVTIRVTSSDPQGAPDVFPLDVRSGKSGGRDFVFCSYGLERPAKSVRLINPQPGEWLVLLDAASLNTRSTYRYTVIAESPASK